VSKIIICDGLTRETMSPELRYQSSRSNIGRPEISRLLGIGRSFGQGPLPRFLKLAVDAARTDGAEVKLLFLCDIATSQEAAQNSQLLDFVEPFDELSAHGTVIPTNAGAIPWQSILEEIGYMDHTAMQPVNFDRAPRFLIVGCQTEGRVLAIGHLLRNMLGFPEVAVCSHLVGSATQDAHLAALRHNLPAAGVRVFLDLIAAANFVGLNAAELQDLNLQACQIEPEEARDQLNDEQSEIIQRICMQWSRAELRPLQGGFSGSLLFLASGWKGEARTEPMVIKIDRVEHMRSELDGYHRVKDFVGKHVPTFGYPVAINEFIGVGMELAAMEGQPGTLQDDFEELACDASASRFMRRLEKVIGLLSDRLYENTQATSWIVPYREFLLHTEDQVRWLAANAAQIKKYAEEEGLENIRINSTQTQKILRLIARNEDGIESEVCLAHGDLNFKNIICDESNNIWFIDWTHSGEHPIELDFAKLENDVKFVLMTKFDGNDLPELKRFEAYLISQRIPAAAEELPGNLQFVKDDARYLSVLNAVSRIRAACFVLKQTDEWLIYKVALLKYALHTLSFDSRRNRGECKLIQLLHAFFSAEGLAFELVADDYHLRIRGERPPSYPPRQRISIDEAPWAIDCAGYDPPYHVEQQVVENDRRKNGRGWADPENFNEARDNVLAGESKVRDTKARPLNPRGRTGMAGRGMLGRWGANPAVGAVVTRSNPEEDVVEILTGRRGTTGLSLPRGFVFPNETAEEAMGRILKDKAGYPASAAGAEVLFDEYYYDPRQTDHAWIELCAYLFKPELAIDTGSLQPTDAFDEVEWTPLTADTVNDISSSGARLVRIAVQRLKDNGEIDVDYATKLLQKTG
jgi:ADP-ribose pyrophosphatase